MPLSELEEAVLIAMTGHTGLTMPDRPFQDPATGEFVMAKPNLTMDGRTAGSPDNAQGTHFFMINDSGTYYLRRVPLAATATRAQSGNADRACAAGKVKVLDRRLDMAEGRGLSQPISIPTACCRTSPARRSSFRSSTSRGSTSTA